MADKYAWSLIMQIWKHIILLLNYKGIHDQ